MRDFSQHLATAAVCVSCSLAAAQSADLNGDATVNCRDVELLQAEILSGQNDPSLDLDGDGEVTRLDVDRWLSSAGDELGFGDALNYGDINLDGVVDTVDFLTMASNYNERFSATESFSKGDFDLNTIVDIRDFIGFREVFNSQAGAAAVPEPGSAAMLSAAGAMLLWGVRRRRR